MGLKKSPRIPSEMCCCPLYRHRAKAFLFSFVQLCEFCIHVDAALSVYMEIITKHNHAPHNNNNNKSLWTDKYIDSFGGGVCSGKDRSTVGEAFIRLGEKCDKTKHTHFILWPKNSHTPHCYSIMSLVSNARFYSG